jgi:3'-5' exoribonuclease
MRGCIRSTVHHGFVPPAELHAVPTPPAAIATLRAGDEVRAVFACTRKDRLTARTGTPYLALELRDRTGAIPARVFRDADLHAGRFEQGDLVRVTGRVERFRDALQIEVRAIARAADKDGNRFSAIVLGVVRSPQFRMRVKQ